MYKRYVEDDDTDTLRTRGEDIATHLRQAAGAISRVKDPAARDALRQLLYVLQQSNEVLYDLSRAPIRRARTSRMSGPSVQ
jgi:hypothetical protein